MLYFRPEMELSWSCFLSLACVALSAASIIPILIATYKLEDRFRANVKIDSVRDKRIKQYFRDLTATSHQKVILILFVYDCRRTDWKL